MAATMKTSTLEKTQNSFRNGTHSTIYQLIRDPDLKKKNILKEDRRKFPFVSGSSYNGEWKDDMKEGFGCLVYADGTKYEGEWSRNKKHGNGTLWIKKGKKSTKQYVGNWEENKMQGFGTYYYENEEVYKGNWVDNRRNGHGRLEYPNGDYVMGEWVDDVQQGPGILHISNGNVFEGIWLNGRREGPGLFFYAATMKVYEGEWVDDQPRCGEYRDPRPEELSRFGEATVRKETFELPEIGLDNPRFVLDLATSEIRSQRGPRLQSAGGGGDGFAEVPFSESELETAEEIFQELDKKNAGVVSMWSLDDVFAALGIEMTSQIMGDIARQLDLGDFATLSFPEVVDIATFINANRF